MFNANRVEKYLKRNISTRAVLGNEALLVGTQGTDWANVYNLHLPEQECEVAFFLRVNHKCKYRLANGFDDRDP